MSYRQAIYDEWPRSGIPDFFENQSDYDAFADLLKEVGAIKDASFFWWVIRPAVKFPTLELRIADVCTRIEDAVALASLFRSLIATLVARPELGSQRCAYTRRLIDENRWRCKRDGVDASVIDASRRTTVAVREAVQEMLVMVGDQARRLKCEHALAQIPKILELGPSAQSQLRIYNECRAGGAESDEALRKVVRWLIDATCSNVSTHGSA
jgi:carboxylate-amine ligase